MAKRKPPAEPLLLPVVRLAVMPISYTPPGVDGMVAAWMIKVIYPNGSISWCGTGVPHSRPLAVILTGVEGAAEVECGYHSGDTWIAAPAVPWPTNARIDSPQQQTTQVNDRTLTVIRPESFDYQSHPQLWVKIDHES